MKNNIFKLILLMGISLLLTGCSEDKNAPLYESFVIDVAFDSTNIPSELTLWDQQYFEKDDVDKEKQVLFDDTIYIGKYNKSIIRKCESYSTDIYITDNGIKFGVKENSNQLVLLNLMNTEFFNTEPFKDDIKDSEKIALDFAKEIASKYIDISQYEILQEEPVTREKNKDESTYYITYYTFNFAKKVNDVYSSDYLGVKITSKGNLASLYIGDLNVFDNIGKIDFSLDDINKVNYEKVLETYKYNNYEVIEQNINNQRLVITPDGNLALYSIIDVKLKLSEDEKIFESGISILTYIK